MKHPKLPSRVTDIVDVDEFLECQPWNGNRERQEPWNGTKAANGHANADDVIDIASPSDDEDIVVPPDDAMDTLEMQPFMDQVGTSVLVQSLQAQVAAQTAELKILKLKQEKRDQETSLHYVQTIQQLQQRVDSLQKELHSGFHDLQKEKKQYHQAYDKQLESVRDEIQGITAKGRERLPQDSFSLLAVAETWSLPWIFSIFILAMQLTCFSLVTVDIISSGEKGNVFAVPGSVSPQLRGIQIIAILIAVATENDLVKGVRMLRPRLYQTLQPHFEHVALWKFWLALISLLSEGCIALLASFLLIVTQTTVIDLLLNFTALGFVSNLDELVFFLSKMGILGRRCKAAVLTVIETSFPASGGTGIRHEKTLLKTIILSIIIIIMFSGWGVIAYRQSTGYYFCDTIIAQFGDDFSPALGTFSGIYKIHKPNLRFFQANYVEYWMEVPANDQQGAKALFAKFAYCDQEDVMAWTFVREADADPCVHWLARSSKMEAFDILQTVDSAWYVRGTDQRIVVLEPMSLNCYDCNDEVGCHGRGTCVTMLGNNNNMCFCEDPWFGLRCEFMTPCESVSIDAMTEPFMSDRKFSNEYNILRTESGSMFQVYYRPVYVHKRDDAWGSGTDVIFFTGRRWALTAVEGNVTEIKLPNFFQMNVSVDFLSEPTDFQTLTDQYSPIGLQWFKATAMERTGPNEKQGVAASVTSRLMCKVCDNQTNPCLYDGVCQSNGTCACSVGSEGDLCEISPVGNGHCDIFFNTIQYEYDRGDCCESTCKSSDDFICGTESSGYTSSGYFFCHLPNGQWLQNGEAVLVEDPGPAPGSKLALTQNGQVLVVAGLAGSGGAIYIYDKKGPQWTQREVVEGIGSVTTFAVRAKNSNAYLNPDFTPPLLLAASHRTGFDIFECTQTSYGCASLPILPNITGRVDDVAISGNSNFVSAVTSENRIFIHELRRGQMQRIATIAPTQRIFTASLSSDATFVASLGCVLLDGPEEVCENVIIEVYEWDGSTYVSKATNYMNISFAVDEDIGWNAESKAFGLELSGDGSVLASWALNCGRGITQIEVYDWANSWKKRDIPMINTTTCDDTLCFGDGDCVDNPEKLGAAALSSDGSILTFRTGGDVVAEVMEWSGEAWEALGESLPTTPSGGLAIAADGSVVGATTFVPNKNGQVTVYSFSRQRCPEGMSLLRISLTLDDFPGETFWTLSDYSTGERMREGGDYSRDFQTGTIVEETCVAASSCLVYTLFDSARNGLRPPGHYALFLDGKDVGNGHLMGTFTSVVIGDCDICLVPVVSPECALCDCRNPFRGSIPTELGFLTPLNQLHLTDRDETTGVIPSEIGILTSLSSLDFSNVNLTGSVPSEIGQLTALTIFRATELSNVSGPLPSEIGQLSRLEVLELKDTGLSGTVPSELALITGLQKLELENTQLTGSIPAEIFDSFLNLNEFKILNTSLTGTIPTKVCAVIIFDCSATLCGCRCPCPN